MLISLNSIAFSTTLLAVSNCQHAPRRSLSHEWVAGYEPLSPVADYNVMDLDQLAMEVELEKGEHSGFLSARAIYEIGGNSMSIAALKIRGTGLPIDVSEGMPVQGWNTNGDIVDGMVYENAPQGSTELKVQYTPSNMQQNHLTCKVGALSNPITDGCFKDGNHTFSVLERQVDYEYDVFGGTINGRTLKQLSLGENTMMISSDEDNNDGYGYFFNDLDHFVSYYGRTGYADTIINAAFNGDAAILNGKVFDFEPYSVFARAEVIKKLTVNMGFAMNVINALEISAGSCGVSGTFDEDPIESLDRAVAYYTGSLEGRHGLGDGYLLYSQADKHCVGFRTCGHWANSVSGTSKINLEIFQLFDRMKENIKKNQCDAIRVTKNSLVKKMFVPMVQGALRSAYIQESYDDSDTYEQSRGVAFAAAVLPLVARCSESDANVIYDNLGTQSGFDSDFNAVKSAFERNYDCMGVTCADVGGLFNKGEAEFYIGAHLCNARSSGINSGVRALFLSCVVLLFAIFVLLIVRRFYCKKGSHCFGGVAGAPLPDETKPLPTVDDDVVFTSVDADHV